MNRRSVLVAGGSTLTVLVAGCLGDDGDDDSPESVVESFMTAIDAGDRDTIDSLLHPDHRSDTQEFSEDYLNLFESADIEVHETTLLEEEENLARVEVSMTLTTDGSDLSDEPVIVLRPDEDAWLIYDWTNPA